MDKAQEKIGNDLTLLLADEGGKTFRHTAQRIAKYLEINGCRKLPEGEPPLIKSPYKPDDCDDEIYCDIGELKAAFFIEGAQAQRDSDIKWMRRL